MLQVSRVLPYRREILAAPLQKGKIPDRVLIGLAGPVGTSVIAVELRREGGADAAFYPWDKAKTPAQYLPDLITPNMAVRRSELWYSESNTPPPWWRP